MLLNWATPEKIQTGGVEDILFWKSPLVFLDLSLYPWKFQTKWSFTPGNSNKSCHTHWNFQGQKPRPMEFAHYFFLDHAWMFHFFFYWLLEFPDSIFSVPSEIPYPKPPCPPSLFVFFSGISLEVVTASQTKICKLSISRAHALENEPKRNCLTFVHVLCQPWQPYDNKSANNRWNI